MTFTPIVTLTIALFASSCVMNMASDGVGLRGAEWAPASSWEAADATDEILDELENIIGESRRSAVEGRLARIEEHLRPTFMSMHKNEYGNLGHSSVRYTLHRYFVQQYGWFVKGLDSQGKAWNSSSPVELFRGHVPVKFMSVFERRLSGRGFGLRDMAVLAATLENLIHMEAAKTVTDLFHMYNLTVSDVVPAKTVDVMLDIFMASHILSADIANMSLQTNLMQKSIISESAQSVLQEIAMVYPGWPETQAFIRQVTHQSQPQGGDFTHASMVTLVGQVLEQWSQWRNHECMNTKKLLLDIEDSNSGCVRLSDFYRSHTEKGVWQFGETAAYLRQQGILDESMPNDPHVIVPNYINSAGNCISSSQFFSACCQNECEGIMDHLEQKIMAPDATPEEIINIVAQLPSSTTPASRVISADLRRRLDGIAEARGGRVHLHGRLFAQWMHHAYPRECPFPHMSGKFHMKNLWEVKNPDNVFITEAEAKQVIGMLPHQSQPTSKPSASDSTCAPWHDEEEIFALPRSAMHSLAVLEEDESLWKAWVCMVMISSLAAFAIQGIRTFKRATDSISSKQTIKLPVQV